MNGFPSTGRVSRLGLLTLLVTALGLVSCKALGPDFAPAPMVHPEQWNAPGTAQARADTEQIQRWWQAFGDSQLNQLVEQAIAHNQDLAIAREHLLQARAERTQVASRLGPTLGIGASDEAFRSSKEVEWPRGIGRSSTYRLGVDSVWELDILGGNRRALEAADAQVEAVAQERHGVLVSLLAELASNYAQLRSSQARLLIAEDDVANLRASERLIEQALSHGLGTHQEVAQARAERESAQARLPEFQADIVRRSHALGVLTGGFAGDLRAQLGSQKPSLPVAPQLPVVLPSQVIAGRPDLRVAYLQWAASTAEIGVAMAERFPRFNIPMSLGTTASNLSDLFSGASMAWSLALQASQTVYDGGRGAAGVQAAESRARAAGLTYERNVRVALREVEDALTGLNAERQRQQSLAAAVTDSHIALDQAMRLYRNGLSGYLPVLTAQRTAYQSRDSLARSQLSSVQGAIDLYKALGSGWQPLDIAQSDTPGSSP